MQIYNNYPKSLLQQRIKQEQEYALSKIPQILAYNRSKAFEELWGSNNAKQMINFNASVVYYYILKALFIQEFNTVSLGLLIPNNVPPSLRAVVKHLNGQYTRHRSWINKNITYFKNVVDVTFKMTRFG